MHIKNKFFDFSGKIFVENLTKKRVSEEKAHVKRNCKNSKSQRISHKEQLENTEIAKNILWRPNAEEDKFFKFSVRIERTVKIRSRDGGKNDFSLRDTR